VPCQVSLFIAKLLTPAKSLRLYQIVLARSRGIAVSLSDKKRRPTMAAFFQVLAMQQFIVLNLGCLERLVDVGDDIFNFLDADGEANEVGGDPRRHLFLR
jgi:hypothetical protein